MNIYQEHLISWECVTVNESVFSIDLMHSWCSSLKQLRRNRCNIRLGQQSAFQKMPKSESTD